MTPAFVRGCYTPAEMIEYPRRGDDWDRNRAAEWIASSCPLSIQLAMRIAEELCFVADAYAVPREDWRAIRDAWNRLGTD